MRVKLKDYITIQNGYAFKSKSFQNDGIPVVRITNVEDGFFNLNKVVYYQEDKKLSKFFIKKGDILLALTGDDKTLKLCINNYEKKMYLNQRVAILRSNNKLEQKYLYYTIKRFSKNILKKAKGIAQKNIGVDDINSLQIPLPPLPKQKAIAQKLDFAQRLIDLRKESITKLDDLAKSVFVEMFGDPVENEMGWEVVKLKNVLTNIDGGWSPVCESRIRKNDNNGILKLSALTNDVYNQLENKEMKIDTKPKLETMVEKGDLLFSRKNTYMLVGSCAYVFETKANLFLPDLIFRLKIIENINSIFLWKYLTNDMVKIGLRNLSNGAAASMPNISKAKLLDFKIYLPPLTLQTKFAQTIQKIEAQKALYEQELVKLEESFEGLLQESFD